MRSLVAVSILPLLLAGCPKGGGAADPKVVDEPEKPVAVNDPEIRCFDEPDRDRTVFVLDITYPDGCPVIPSEFDGQIHDFEIEVSGTPPAPVIVDPVDLIRKTFTWASAGCGARIHFEGAIGAVDVEFAATSSGEATGTGTWTPTGGAACAITLEGRYSDYTKREEEEEEEEDEDENE